jgi:carboxylesterase
MSPTARLVHTSAMTIHPLAAPYSAPAQPELTGGRRIGVLLSHDFTGQPASITPWGQALAEKGYAVEVPRLPGHGTTWQELNTHRW